MEHIVKAPKEQGRIATRRWLDTLHYYFVDLSGWKRTAALALVLALPLTLQPIRDIFLRVFERFLTSKPTSSNVAFPDLYEASVMELQAGLDAQHFTSVDLVKAYFARIEEVNIKGPAKPVGSGQAADLDKERKIDNIATIASEGMNTTAGSYSLLGSVVPEDAGVIKRLRNAGAIILGKANLSEFSYFRGIRGELPSGWSGRGGQTTNAYYPNADPCGSSSGSGPYHVGHRNGWKYICPSSLNNVVGMKPTVGLTSRAGVIPISSTQDSVGPMTRSVEDAAILLSIISGKDQNDDATLSQPSIVPDFTKALKKDALRGKRIGVPRRVFMDEKVASNDPSVGVAFEEALNVLRSLGATVVDPANLPSAEDISKSDYETLVLEVECKVCLHLTIARIADRVRSLADVIKFNDGNPGLEKPEGYEAKAASAGRDAAYLEALAFDYEYGRTRGIDAALKEHELDALVLPSVGSSWSPAAIAGYPIITVPLGFYPEDIPIKSDEGSSRPFSQAPGMPFGISFFSTAYSEFELIGYAYAYEQATHTRLARKAYPKAIPRTQLKDVVKK
ncbi:amidase signature enzyme [Pholiota molesta]|nr:amidase signature enzyme [Pholiota molesta]